MIASLLRPRDYHSERTLPRVIQVTRRRLVFQSLEHEAPTAAPCLHRLFSESSRESDRDVVRRRSAMHEEVPGDVVGQDDRGRSAPSAGGRAVDPEGPNPGEPPDRSATLCP